MKKLLVCLGLLMLVPGLALAQADAFAYYVGYFANNPGPGTGVPDQVVRIVNTGTIGTPLTSPVGDICANIYVFDNNQEMVACCAEQITPDELDSAAVGAQLTSNPLTSVVPTAGVFKIITTVVPAGGCDPTALPALLGGAASVFSTHLQVTGGRTFVTETTNRGSVLSAAEFGFLQQACAFTLYLGSGKGTCTSSVPGH